MRKVLSFLFASTLVVIISSFNTPKRQEMATVYIYRVGQFAGSGANWAIFADEVKICKLSNNRYIKHEVKPGKHTYTAKIGGVELLKKETEIEINAEAGQSYYIACNVKQSIMRARLEMVEVTKSSADKQMAKMTLDNCQEEIETGKK